MWCKKQKINKFLVVLTLAKKDCWLVFLFVGQETLSKTNEWKQRQQKSGSGRDNALKKP